MSGITSQYSPFVSNYIIPKSGYPSRAIVFNTENTFLYGTTFGSQSSTRNLGKIDMNGNFVYISLYIQIIILQIMGVLFHI